MDGQTQESLKPTWLSPEALVEFIDELRRNGFNIGLAEYIAAQDLLLMLAARGENLDTPQRAVSLLGPLLCSSPAEQESFPEFFHRWSERQLAKLGGQIALHEETMAEALEDTAKRGLRWEWILFALGVIILAGTAWSLIRNYVPVSVPPGGQPRPSDPSSDVSPLLQLASVAVGLLILAYVAWWAWWRRLADQFLQRRQGEGTPDIKQISLTTSDEALFPSLTFLSLARLFRRRVQVVSRELNVVKTVEHSVEQGGWLKPIYDHLMIPPEYLVLVDRRTRFDHLAEFVEGMVKRLETHGVFITAYTFDGDPRLCFPLNRKDAPQSLSELAARYENMRLIIFSDAQGLLNPVSGRLPPWSRLFNRWIYRSVLTPEPPVNWGAAEHELQREFIVLPGTGDGLAALMGIIQGQSKVGEINTWADSAIPAVLQERPQRWIERDSPSAAEIDSLLDELRTYLGEVGYAWFEACAVYPELHWQITITLGQLLKDGEGQPLLDSERLIDLSRLPWFRFGIMPDWLRTRLILDLAPSREEEVRAALEALLVTALQGHGEALDLEIAHERRDWTSRLARPLLRLLRREAPPDSPIQDHVFLDFMLQRLNLAVRVPETMRRQLLAKVGDQTGWRIAAQWSVMNLLAISLWAITLFIWDDFRGLDFDSIAGYLSGSQLGFLIGLAQWLTLRRFWPVNAWLWIAGSMAVYTLLTWLYNTGVIETPSYYGFFSLSIISVFQTILITRLRIIPFARRWLLSGVLAGLINMIWPSLVSLVTDTELTFTIMSAVAGCIVYGIISGWMLLLFLHKRSVSAVSLLRQSWGLLNPIGFYLGFFVALALPFYLFEPFGIQEGDFAYGFTVNLILMFFIALIQWLILRSSKFALASAWFWATFVSGGISVLLFGRSNIGSDAGLGVLYGTPMIGVGLGLISGFVQALICRRNGVQPFQMLVWILVSTVGWSTTFVFLSNFVADASFDLILASIFFSGMAYSVVTMFPLNRLLTEVVHYQKTIKI